ncbi:MAG: NADH-quinone oxidoreductase subunit L [Pseudomonadota bacterium]
MYHLIVFLPLLGFLIAGLFGRVIGDKASEYITSGLLVLSAILSWVAFIQVGFGEREAFTVPVLRFIESGDFIADWAFRIDTLTVVMLVVVTSVSSLVHIYSIGYMHHDPHRSRFFAYLSLFTFAMLMLVTADNLVQMFFGWEGVGLASYLLIGFWYHKPSANAAAMKAFIVNRVGDFGFALGIFATFYIFGSVQFETIFSTASGMIDSEGQVLSGEPVINVIGYELALDTALTVTCLLLFMGAMGKSAQFILHTWLPDAMEGPTPVSALIHAATMVTAGVFLVARMSPVFELSQTALIFVTFMGAFTALFAATVGLVQNDIKRVIAYSTCSQLGYMFVALGVGAYSIGIFHLFTHAFFKALLFLGAGSVIHAVSDEQDMRKMGGLAKHIPITYWMMLIGTLALTGVGLPGLYIGTAGFFSKDAIIEAAYAVGYNEDGIYQNSAAWFAFAATVTAALLTSFYSWRLIFMTFHGKPRAPASVMSHVHESPPVMTVPLLILAVGSVFAGMVFYDSFVYHGYGAFWKDALFTAPNNHVMHDFHDVPFIVKSAATIMMVIGLGLAYWFYIARPELPKQVAEAQPQLYKFLLNKWYIDELYDFLFVRPAMWIGRFFWKRGDGWLIDGFGPDGISARVLDMTNRIVKLQSGFIYHYAFAMMIGVALLVTWSMF